MHNWLTVLILGSLALRPFRNSMDSMGSDSESAPPPRKIRVFLKRAGESAGRWCEFNEGTTLGSVVRIGSTERALVGETLQSPGYVLQDNDRVSVKNVGQTNG